MNWLKENHLFKSLAALIVGISLLFWGIFSHLTPVKRLSITGEPPYLNVYNWYSMIPSKILRQFEKETGIRLRYDLYDNNEMLEAKLLAGKSGYDVVFPSASPYVERQIEAGVYRKLDKSLLPNLVQLDPNIQKQMRLVDPSESYCIPYYWGTIGFAYVEEDILERMPDAPVDSYRMLFDPNVVKNFKSCHVTLLEESVDVYPAILSTLGIDSQSSDPKDLARAQKVLLEIRPSISRFSSQRFVSELVSGESCLAQAWSGDAHLANSQAKEAGRKKTIRYVLPKEGGILWIDGMCIPKDAPHPNNAHLFINFMMRPDIAAAISNEIMLATAIKDAKPLMEEELQHDETIFPPPEVFDRLKLDRVQDQKYDQLRTRYWALAKIG